MMIDLWLWSLRVIKVRLRRRRLVDLTAEFVLSWLVSQQYNGTQIRHRHSSTVLRKKTREFSSAMTYGIVQHSILSCKIHPRFPAMPAYSPPIIYPSDQLRPARQFRAIRYLILSQPLCVLILDPSTVQCWIIKKKCFETACVHHQYGSGSGIHS